LLASVIKRQLWFSPSNFLKHKFYISVIFSALSHPNKKKCLS
jgi:hypothetical protein